MKEYIAELEEQKHKLTEAKRSKAHWLEARFQYS